MNRSFTRLLLPLVGLFGIFNLSSCKHDSDTIYPDGLTGNWKLINRQCECAPNVPNERLVLEQAGHFTFYRDGQPTRSGTYTLGTTVSSCGATASEPAIYFDSGARPSGVGYSLTNGRLILDYGGPCDSPVDTYERQ